jgi:FkbH-like protein
LKTEVSQRSGFCLLNSERLVTRLGAANWYDQQRWNSMRLPMSGEAVAALAREWVRYLGALTLPPRKVAVVDLDNTLWRGIVGEDGYDGIRMDDSPEGWPHRSLQQTLLDLYHRGILLAVCSKNNYQDAWTVIEGHPEMVLRPQHFAAVRINWQDKGSNLREIAQELNVGLESLVFLDDNPQERELVRTTAPEVHVLDVSDDAAEYAQAMRDVIGFERIWLTEDDQKRGQMYAQQRQRELLKTDSKSLEAYLHSLATVVTLEQPVAATIQRVAQLTGKTNQFNLTTKRYHVQQIQEFHDSAESDLLAVSVQDRFGDNGIVGVAILCYHEAVCRIDTLLLSCRVIGRGIETAMLSMIVDRARERRCHSVCGHYIPTEKNAPCADYLDQHGFQRRNDCWMLEDLGSCLVEAPSWITIKSDFVTTHTNR